MVVVIVAVAIAVTAAAGEELGPRKGGPQQAVGRIRAGNLRAEQAAFGEIPTEMHADNQPEISREGIQGEKTMPARATPAIPIPAGVSIEGPMECKLFESRICSEVKVSGRLLWSESAFWIFIFRNTEQTSLYGSGISARKAYRPFRKGKGSSSQSPSLSGLNGGSGGEKS